MCLEFLGIVQTFDNWFIAYNNTVLSRFEGLIVYLTNTTTLIDTKVEVAINSI